MHNNILMNSVRPVFEYLIGLRCRLDSDEKIGIDHLQSELSVIVEKMLSDLNKTLELKEKIYTVGYIVTSLLDNAINYSRWEHADKWRDHLLEEKYFETNVAGDKFFELLQKHGYQDHDLAEIFYNCLLLGFQNDNEEVPKIKNRLYRLINDRLPEDDRFISPGAEQVIAKKDQFLPPMFGTLAIIIIIMILTGLYLIISQWMWNDAAKLIHDTANILRNGY